VQFNAFASNNKRSDRSDRTTNADNNKRSDRGHSSNDLEFLMTVFLERHFRIFANFNFGFSLSVFFVATMEEVASQVD